MNTLYATYAQLFFAESENPNSVFIYVDESYCNEKHNKAFAVLKPDDADLPFQPSNPIRKPPTPANNSTTLIVFFLDMFYLF